MMRTGQAWCSSRSLVAPHRLMQPVRLGVEPRHPFAPQPVPHIVDRVPIGPPAGKPIAFHRPPQVGDVVLAFHHDAGNPGVVGVGPTILDIPDLVTELLQAEQVVYRLPGDAGERHLAGKMENEDRAALAQGSHLLSRSPCHNGRRVDLFRWPGAAADPHRPPENAASRQDPKHVGLPPVRARHARQRSDDRQHSRMADGGCA